jgi:carboxyl-terminal processing protease
MSKVLDLSNHGKATFKIKKPDGTIKTVMLWKEGLEDDDDNNKVKSFVLNGNKKIGFISLPAFYQDWDNQREGINGCANDVAKEILKLKKENIQGLILDLRYNGGGSVMEAVELAGIFLDAGPVAQFKGKDAKVFVLKDVNRGTMYDGPLLILVNGYSASASELVAGTLQDYNRALIVGSSTYGKATAQVVLPLDTTITTESNLNNIRAESFLKVTVSQLFRVNGTTAQFTGVIPDISLPGLSETGLSQEKDQLYAIRPSPILGDKYFRAMPKMEKSHLNLLAKNQVDSSSYFTNLKKYIAFQNLNSLNQTISLKLSDAIAEKRKMDETIFSKSDVEIEQTTYKVDNNIYEKQKLLQNERLNEMNEQWISFLLRDPELEVAYKLISAMIK